MIWQFNTWRHYLALKRLKDHQYLFLFDSPPVDEYVALDCETTSLNPKEAEILSIAAVKIKRHRIMLTEKMECIVRPEGRIKPDTIPIHGLRQQDVEQGVSVTESMQQLIQFIGSRPIIGYYLEFDMAVINRHIKPWLGIHLPNRCIDVSGLYYDQQVSGYCPEVDLRLSSILKTLNLPDIPRHTALNDAITAALIWLKLTAKK